MRETLQKVAVIRRAAHTPRMFPYLLRLRYVLLLTLAALGCTESALRIAPVEPAIAYVGESARIPFEVKNETGNAVTLSWSGPALPFLRRWVTLVAHDGGGELQWDPQPEHVGRHTLTLRARAGDASTERDVAVEVVRARQATPVFLDPPAAVAVDPLATPCMTLPVRVRDNDSVAIDLRLVAGAPPSATFTLDGDREGTVHWCPSPDELATRAVWRFTFEATDDRHPARRHETRVLLVQPERADCPGAAPEIVAFSPADGARVVSEVGYEVRMEVASARRLADAPVLFYTDGRLESRDRLDIASLRATPFFAGDRPNEWIARVPTFRLAEDETKTITTLVWLSDDADPDGTRCDRRAPLRARSFVAVGAVEAGVLPQCAPCTQSGDCQSNVCLATASGGRCVAACTDDVCGTGECAPYASPEGVVREGCGPAALVCEGRALCEPTTASDAALVTDAQVTLCGQSEAVFVWEAAAEGVVTLGARTAALRHPGDGTAALELQVRDARETLIGGQRGDAASVRTCVEAGERLQLTLSSPAAADLDATLQAALEPGDCACRDTASSGALGDGTHTGTLCEGRIVERPIALAPNTRLRVTLESPTAEADLDLEIRDADGRRVGRSAGSQPLETLVVDTTAGGTYGVVIRDARRATLAAWSLEVERTPLAACADDRACAAGELCDAQRCRRLACTRSSDCPENAVCTALFDSGRSCVPTCASDRDCASGHACKATDDGRACGPSGAGGTGEPCATAGDCAGARTCLSWQDGYCAAAGCDGEIRCPEGDVCGVIEGRAVCLQSCWSADTECTRPAPYGCDEVYDTSGEVSFACTPEAR